MLHGARVSAGAAQSIPNNAYTSATYPSGVEIIDTDGYHSFAVNPAEFSIPADLDGWYLCVGTVQWDPSAVGVRGGRWEQSRGGVAIDQDGLILQNAVTVAAFVTTLFSTGTFVGEAGDVLEWQLYQGSGGNLNAQGAIATVIRLGDQP